MKPWLMYKGFVYKFAADPPAEEDVFSGEEAPESPEEPEEEEKYPTQEELLEEIEESPAANWRGIYLVPIQQALKIKFGGEHITLGLKGSHKVEDVGPSRYGGFHIIGRIIFPEGPPPSVLAKYGEESESLFYKVHIGNDGNMHAVHVYPADHEELELD